MCSDAIGRSWVYVCVWPGALSRKADSGVAVGYGSIFLWWSEALIAVLVIWHTCEQEDV